MDHEGQVVKGPVVGRVQQDHQVGIRRIEDLATGRVKGLTEEEFLAALQ